MNIFLSKQDIIKLAKLWVIIALLAILATSCGYQRKPGPEAELATRLLSNDIKEFRLTSGETIIHAPDDLSLFSAIYQNVFVHYVHAVDTQDLMTAASKGMREKYSDSIDISDEELEVAAARSMLVTLDPYSTFMDRDEFRALNEETRGSFGGLGVEVNKASGMLTVISPIDGTPAAASYIKPGDIITHADGVLLEPLSMRESVKLLRGDVGTVVKLTILREDHRPFDVILERAIIKVNPVISRMEGEVGYIRITTFSAGAGIKVHDAMLALEAQNRVRAYVLDLRNNPGGLLDEAISVSSNFLDGGDVVSIKSRDKNESYYAFKGNPSKEVPVVVLINKGSASSSEIVAGALKDRARGILLGEQTYGKGSVQSVLPLGRGRGVKITTAIYYTPNGLTVEGGIIPNLMVELDDEREGDEQMEEALRLAIEMAGGPTILWNTGAVE